MRKPSHKNNPHLIDLIRQLKELDAESPLQFVIMVENMTSGKTEVYSTYRDDIKMLELIDECYDVLLESYD